MGDFVTALDWPTAWTWGMFAFASGATALGGASRRSWRRLNDPPEMHATAGTPEIEVPREAWLGLAGGLVAVVLIVLFISVLV